MPAEDAVPPSVGFAAELLGRHSHAAFEILAEERRIGEIEFVGDLLNGELVIGFEQVFRVHDDRVVDPPRRAVARYGPYYRREVFGRHADLVGVVPDFALADVVLRDQKGETRGTCSPAAFGRSWPAVCRVDRCGRFRSRASSTCGG